MKLSISSLVEEIKQERLSRRQAVPMQPPITSEQLERLLAGSAELDYHFPTAYLAILNLANGINSNGIILYASEEQSLAGHEDRPDYTIEGIVGANIIWRDYEFNKNFVFFAEGGDVVYCHNLITDKFQVMDRIAQDVDDEANVFDTCEALLVQMLNHMLDR